MDDVVVVSGADCKTSSYGCLGRFIMNKDILLDKVKYRLFQHILSVLVHFILAYRMYTKLHKICKIFLNELRHEGQS